MDKALRDATMTVDAYEDIASMLEELGPNEELIRKNLDWFEEHGLLTLGTWGQIRSHFEGHYTGDWRDIPARMRRRRA